MKLKISCSLLILFLNFAFSGFSQNYQDTINAARQASNNGQYKKALKYYKSAERITPKEVDLSQEMGQTAYKAGDFETAERCFDDLASKSKSSKNRSQHTTDSGISSMKAQSYGAAEDKFKEALRNDPSNEKARQLLMEAKRLRKQQEEAEKNKEEKQDQEQEEEQKDQKDQQDSGNEGGQNQKQKNDKNKTSKGNSNEKSNGQSKEGTLEDKQTERKLDELSRQEMDAKRRMNGTNGSQQGKKTTKDW